MKILVLSPLYPDAPSDGDRLRLYHFLRELSQRHELVLACFVDPSRPSDRDDSSLKGIVAETHRVAMPRSMRWFNAGLRYASHLPSNVTAYASGDMRALTEKLLSYVEFDAVFCHRLRMAPYALRARLPRAIDYTDSMTRYFERRAAQAQGFKRTLWSREAAKIAAYEQWCAWQFNAAFMNSEGDAATLRAMAPSATVVTAANGVDFESLKPGTQRRDPDQLVFVGNLAYPPNSEAVAWFVNEVFPLIRRQRPKAKFTVVGGNASRSLLALGKKPGVELSGFSADFRPLLWKAAVSVCPVRLAAGRQNKILDAFACGTPVVATSLTASGCEAKAGEHLLVADDALGFASETLRLMQQPSLGKKLAQKAGSLVRRRYDWSQSARLIEAALRHKP